MTEENFFFKYRKQKMDLKDLDKALPNMPIEYRLPEFDESTNTLKRVITLEEIIKISPKPSESNLGLLGGFDWDGKSFMLQEIIADIKQSYLILDAKFMASKGLTDLYYKDLVPGDTSIVYEISTTGDM